MSLFLFDISDQLLFIVCGQGSHEGVDAVLMSVLGFDKKQPKKLSNVFYNNNNNLYFFNPFALIPVDRQLHLRCQGFRVFRVLSRDTST